MVHIACTTTIITITILSTTFTIVYSFGDKDDTLPREFSIHQETDDQIESYWLQFPAKAQSTSIEGQLPPERPEFTDKVLQLVNYSDKVRNGQDRIMAEIRRMEACILLLAFVCTVLTMAANFLFYYSLFRRIRAFEQLQSYNV